MNKKFKFFQIMKLQQETNSIPECNKVIPEISIEMQRKIYLLNEDFTFS